MKNVLVLLFLIPTYACSSNISNTDQYYNNKEDPTISDTLTVDLSKGYQKLDKQFFGSHIDTYSELPEKALVDELQLGKIRVGGNEFDVYNWDHCKMVNHQGQIKDAPCLETLAGTMAKYNVDAIFQVNLSGYQPVLKDGNYVIERSFTPDAAYQMIKHLKGTKKLTINHVSLGNEFSIWNETHPKVWKSEDAISANDYIDIYIKYAIAVRKAQEELNGNPNSIKLWGPEMTSSWYDWNTGNFAQDCKWTEIKGQVKCSYGNGKFDNFIPYFLNRIKTAESDKAINPKKYKLLDFLSIHYYPNFRTKSSDPRTIITDESGKQLVAEMLDSTRVWNDPTFVNKYDITSYRNFKPNIINRFKDWMSKYYPDAKLTINEYAVDSDYRTHNYHPVVRPLFLADSIGIFAREGIAYFNHFDLSTPANSTLPWSLIEGGERTHLFNVFKLFSTNLKGDVVNVEDNIGPDLNAYATIDKSIITVAIVNKAPVNKKIKLYTKEFLKRKYLDYEVPAWSVSILKLDKNSHSKNDKFSVQVYGAKEMGVAIDPSYERKNHLTPEPGSIAGKLE